MDSKEMVSERMVSKHGFEPGRTHEALNLNRSYLPTVDPNAMKFLQELTYMLKNVLTKFQLNWMIS